MVFVIVDWHLFVFGLLCLMVGCVVLCFVAGVLLVMPALALGS